MNLISQAEKEAVAKDSWTKHDPKFISAIVEIRDRLDLGLKEAKELCDIVRGNAPSRVKSSDLDLARTILSAHGSEYAARELAPRLNCLLDEAEALIKLVSPDPPRTSTEPHYEWNAKSAEKWLRKYASHLRREAKYVSDNASEFASNEDEFRCGLANGLGIDDDKEQDEIIVEIHEGKRKEK